MSAVPSAAHREMVLEQLRAEGRREWRAAFTALALQRVLLAAAFLVAWEFSSGRLIHPFFVSRPSAIFAQLWEWAATGELWVHLQITAFEMIVGFLAGTILGLLLGLFLGLAPTAEKIVSPILIGLNGLPKIALAPLFVVLFGIGIFSKIVLVASVVTFFVLFNTITGVQQADRDLLQALRLMGASRPQTILKVVVPGAIAYMFLGVKISLRYALNYAVVGEILAGNRGIGFLIARSLGNLDTSGVMAGVFLLVIVGVALYEAVVRLEAWSLKWREGICA